MSYPVYDLEPGVCTCILGDPRAGSRRAAVVRLSAAGALVDPGAALAEGQYAYASLVLEGGPSLALAGFVVSVFRSGTFIRWDHASPAEADKLDRILRAHMKKIGKLPAEPPPPPAPPAAPDRRPAEGAPRREAPRSGTIDVAAAVRKKARRVRSRDIASRLETVNVLDVATIHALIEEAVDDSVALLGHELKDAERRRILEEAEGGFRERLRAEKASLEERARLLEEQLEKTTVLLEEERARVVRASQFTVSDAGMVELEGRLGRMLDRAVSKGQADAVLEKDLRETVVRLLDDEREKIRAQAQEAQNDRIALLEKKVGRLASSLESARGERDQARRRAQALEAAGGIPLRNLRAAGLDEGDPGKERKLVLLQEIARFNREMRGELASRGRLPKPAAPAPPAEKVEAGAGGGETVLA